MESTTTFTHSHRHASQVAYDPRWTPHRAIGTTPYYLADQTRAVYTPHHALFPPPLKARGGKEAPDRGGDRTYRRRCGGINRALGWYAPWGGAPARSIRRFCCGL